MKLYLLRHGIAEDLGAPDAETDFDRQLTPEGRQKVRQIARAMEALDLKFDVILSSPYPRARQTAELVAKLGLGPKPRLAESLEPGGRASELVAALNLIKPQPALALLVGHEPHLSGFASLLLSGTPGLPIVLKKGGLICLEAKSLKPGRCAELRGLLTPSQMALMR